MTKDASSAPTMQDLRDPQSLIRQAFMRLTPPEAAFDPDGRWTHVYHDLSSFGLSRVQGRVTLQHRPEHHLRIESYRHCPDGYLYSTTAELECVSDALHTPTAWLVESKVAKRADAPAYLNSGLTRRANVKDGILTMQVGGRSYALELPGRYACKWCLLDAVGRLAMRRTKQMDFTLLDEYDAICPGQVLSLRGAADVETRTGTIKVVCYQHTGIGTVPGFFYVDGVGRTLIYLAGMQLLALADASGEATGYLK